MSKLNQFYTDVLSKINYSIIGNRNIDLKLNDFFSEICDSVWFLENKNISCISYAYAKLLDIDNFDIKTLSSDSFFFNSFYEKSLEEFIVSDYGLFRKYLEFYTGHVVSTSETISKLFDKNPVSFRIKCTEAQHCGVEYEQHLNLITFSIPHKVLIKDSVSYIDGKQRIYKIYENKLLSQVINKLSLKKNVNVYEYDKSVRDSYNDAKNKNTYLKKNLLIYDILNTLEIKNVHNLFSKKLNLLNRTNNSYFFYNENDAKQTLINQFINTILSHGLFAFIYDITMENIPSVVYVNEFNKTKHSLGTFIVGYKEELGFEERVKFRLLSDKISSVISAQFTFENNEEIQLNLKRGKWVQLFKKLGETLDDKDLNSTNNSIDRSHGTTNVDENLINRWCEISENIDPILPKPFVLQQDKYSQVLISENKTHQGLLLNFDPAISLVEDFVFYKKVNRNANKINYLDILMIEHFCKLLNIRKKCTCETPCSPNCSKENIDSIKVLNEEIIIECKFGEDENNKFSFKRLFSKLKSPEIGSNFSNFIIEQYSIFRIIGDLEIWKDHNTELFSLSKNLMINSEKKVIIKKERTDSYSDLIFKIKVKLPQE